MIVDRYEGLDQVASSFEEIPATGQQRNVIVDLAAQTAAPLARWIKDSDLLPLLSEMGVTVNFWHISDAGKDSVDLLDRLINTYGPGPNYIVVKNFGRGSNFIDLEESAALKKAMALGARVVTLGPLHESSMRKIDNQNASFWAAINNRVQDENALGMLERQRVKTWLRNSYEMLDGLPF